VLRTDEEGQGGPIEIALVTGTPGAMPVPDPESDVLIAALAERGVRSALVPWTADHGWAATPLVVCRTPWDYVGRSAEFLGWARATAAATRLLNPAGLVEWNVHKRYLVELQERGVPVVPTTVLTPNSSPAARTAAVGGTGELVIKPAVSGGAQGTIRVAADADAAREHLAGLLRDGDALVQPYLPEVEDGEVSLILFGGRLSHAVRKTPAPGDFRVQGEHGGTVSPHEPSAAEQGVARQVLEGLPWAPAYARIDLVITPEGPLLMEAELIEPELFLHADPAAAGRFADVLVADLRG
jgi:glutathione synthase/RimK-type ligase-like ATP-grasp enzyme